MINIDEDTDIERQLQDCDGILLTPGFGERAVDGMIQSAEYAMENRIPFLGICFGAQLFWIAFCRKYLGLKEANSTEINENTPEPVVDLLESQKNITEKGGTMRLGGLKVYLKEGTKLYEAYNQKEIVERFRHRYHINVDYFTQEAKDKGMVISSTDKTGKIINSIELDREDHWMVGTQFHPEFKSKPYRFSPAYFGFVKECIKHKNERDSTSE
jgi:CTP synthase